MTATTDLNCRLLCACEVASDIKPDGSFKQVQPYYDAVGFTGEPAIISGGIEGIDACLVGTCDDCVILAFRGTLPPAKDLPSILDWLQDFLAITISVEGLPGKVHDGFYRSVTKIWKKLLDEVKTQTKGGKPLYITGHSKGASMATLSSIMLNNLEGIKAKDVVTIASPNTGDGEFKKGYDAVFSQTRYTNHLDLVPFLPPTPAFAEKLEDLPLVGELFKDFAKCDYQPVGSGIFVNKEGGTISEAEHPAEYSEAITADLKEIGEKLEKLDIKTIASAHSEDCGSGYMKGVCGDAVCNP